MNVIDKLLIWLMPNVFALNRRVVLKKLNKLFFCRIIDLYNEKLLTLNLIHLNFQLFY